MKKHVIPAVCAALLTALSCGTPAVHAAPSPSQTFNVFGDHSDFDPLNPYYIYGKALLNGTKKLPENGGFYYTGQIFVAGEKYDGTIPKVQDLTYIYSNRAKGYFIWDEETVLSVSDAEKLCEIIQKLADKQGYAMRQAPTLVYCTKTPVPLTGDVDYDNKITVSDAKLLMDSVVYASIHPEYGSYDVTKHLYPTGDVDNDNTYDITDVKNILDYAVYTLTFNRESEWKDIIAKKPARLIAQTTPSYL